MADWITMAEAMADWIAVAAAIGFAFGLIIDFLMDRLSVFEEEEHKGRKDG